jgi:hypothetical protein
MRARVLLALHNLRLRARGGLRWFLRLPRVVTRGRSQSPPPLTILAVLANIALALSFTVSPWVLFAGLPIAAAALVIFRRGGR